MTELLGVWEWLKGNHGLVAECVLAVIVAAKMVTKLTATPKDDAAVEKAEGWVMKVLGWLGYKKSEEPKK